MRCRFKSDRPHHLLPGANSATGLPVLRGHFGRSGKIRAGGSSCGGIGLENRRNWAKPVDRDRVAGNPGKGPPPRQPRTTERGPLGLPSALVLLFSSSSRAAQRSAEPRRERTALFSRGSVPAGALPALLLDLRTQQLRKMVQGTHRRRSCCVWRALERPRGPGAPPYRTRLRSSAHA